MAGDPFTDAERAEFARVQRNSQKGLALRFRDVNAIIERLEIEKLAVVRLGEQFVMRDDKDNPQFQNVVNQFTRVTDRLDFCYALKAKIETETYEEALPLNLERAQRNPQ